MKSDNAAAGLPSEGLGASSRRPLQGRQDDSFVPCTSGSEDEDDLYLLAKSLFDMKVSKGFTNGRYLLSFFLLLAYAQCIEGHGRICIVCWGSGIWTHALD